MKDVLKSGLFARWKVGLRALFTAVFVLSVFVLVASYMGPGAETRGPGFVIRAPDDWANGFRMAMTALLVSATGALLGRRHFSRPVIVALALGLAVTNLDPSFLWQYVVKIVSIPPSLASEGVGGISADVEKFARFAAYARRIRIYLIFYAMYVFWALIILYCGYIGQYLVGFVLAGGRRARRESSLYIAENAGLGLICAIGAGVAAGLTASVLLAGMVGTVDHGAAIESWRALPQVLVPESPAVTGNGPGKGRDIPGKAPESEVPARRSASRLIPLRVPLLAAGLSFLIMAYLAGVIARPRTSTWVACGAVAGVMIVPVAAVFVLLPMQSAEGSRVLSTGEIDYLARNLRTYGKFFHLLELPPFVLVATAVTAALSGDWIAKTLIRSARSQYRRETFRPL